MTGHFCTLQSPLGPIRLRQESDRLTELRFESTPSLMPAATALLAEAADQLQAYFQGRLTRFDLPMDWGAGLHEKVRRAMAAIPYGATRSYGEIARDVAAPAQAVGQACGANPLPILIPCHRVLAARGLGGFSAKGGVETKVWLLRHEGAAGLLI